MPHCADLAVMVELRQLLNIYHWPANGTTVCPCQGTSKLTWVEWSNQAKDTYACNNQSRITKL